MSDLINVQPGDRLIVTERVEFGRDDIVLEPGDEVEVLHRITLSVRTTKPNARWPRCVGLEVHQVRRSQ